MKLQFITAEIHLNPISTDLQQTIQTHLKTQGEPLRWSIAAVEDGMICIEAIVLQDIDGID
jgi:hypothetical protein